MEKDNKKIEKKENVKLIRRKDFFKSIRCDNPNKKDDGLLRYRDYFIDIPIDRTEKDEGR